MKIERKWTVRLGLLLASVMLVCIAAPVAAINVVETVDYPGGSSFGLGSVSVGILEPGGNTVAGTLAGFCVINDCNGVGAGDTQDSFKVTVPSGYSIQSLTVTTANVAGPAGFSVTVNLRSPVSDLIPTTFVVLGGTTANLVASPIGAGEYSFSIFGQIASQAGPYSLSWSIAIQIVLDNALFSDGFEFGDTSRWSSGM
jgi:hypothetical protein